MKIEVPSGPSVAADAAPAQFQEGAYPAYEAGRLAQGTAAIGSALKSLGNDMFRAWEKRKGLRDESMAKDADVAATNELMELEFGEKGYLRTQGKTAAEGFKSALDSAQNVRKKYLEQLPNDEARKMFDNAFVRRLQYSMQTIGAHANRENLQWMRESSKAREASLVSDGALNWNNLDRFQKETIPGVVSEVLSRRELEGWDDATTNQNIRVAIDAAHITRLKSVVQYSPGMAIGQLEQISPQLSANGRLEAEKTILHGIQLAHTQEQWAKERKRYEQQENDEKIGQGFFTKYIKGELSPTEIDKSNMTVPHKQHWYALVDAQNRRDAKLENSDPSVVSDLVRRITLPYGDQQKITDINEIYAQVGKGVSLSHAGMLIKMISDQRTPEGIRLSDSRNRVFTNLRAQFVNDAITGGDVQGGKDFIEFQSWALDKEAQMYKDKKDPHDLYNARSPEYIGNQVDSFKASAQERMRRQLESLKPAPFTVKGTIGNVKVSPVIPRLKGESIDAYRARVAGATREQAE